MAAGDIFFGGRRVSTIFCIWTNSHQEQKPIYCIKRNVYGMNIARMKLSITAPWKRHREKCENSIKKSGKADETLRR